MVGSDMKVETKELEYCKVHVLYESDSNTVNAKIDEAVAELRKVQIPGFRKGKAPDYAIKARCKNRINDWVAREMSGQAYDDMVFETNMKPIGMPEYENIKIKGNKFSCEMTVMKKPDFELKPYTEYELDKPLFNREVDPQVQVALDNIRLRLGDMLPYEEGDVIEKGDQITMSFEANIDGETFDGSVEEGKLYVVGESLFPDFDDYILGMKSEEEREFDLVMPEELSGDFPDIGGKTVSFKVTVHAGTKRKPCEMNEEFFQKVGAKDSEDLTDKLTSVVKHRINETERNFLRTQVTNKLVSDNEFKIPEFLIEAETKHFALQNGVMWEKLEESRKEAVTKIAERSVRLSLILDSIREEEPDSVLNDTEAQNGLMQRAVAQGQDPEKFLVEAKKNGSLFGMVSALRDEFSLQWVINQSTIKEAKDEEKEEA
jgi:trigger factor